MAALDSQPCVGVVHAVVVVVVAFAAACCDGDEPSGALEEPLFVGPLAAVASSLVDLAVQQGAVGPCSALVFVVGALRLAVVVVVGVAD